MLSKTITLGVNGIYAEVIEVEVDILRGLPNFILVGLPDSVVKESKERIRSAIENSGFDLPPKNYIINLAPAGFKKQGANFDLAIAAAILKVTGQVDFDLARMPMIGELSLNGELRPVKGVLSMCLTLYRNGYDSVIVPYENRNEAAAISDIKVYGIKRLSDITSVFNGRVKPQEYRVIKNDNIHESDFSNVCGQESVKRAIEIAVAGNHNLLMYGPPGSGKTLLARSIPTIMPDLTKEEAIEVTMIHSVGGLLEAGSGLVSSPPFRTPHHTASDVSLVGGGKIPGAGEVSLSHNGVLFLDEFVEFKNNVLQSLRQPLEDHKITISRASGSSTFPADFMLVAASNPCQCGYMFDKEMDCRCSPLQIRNYFKKISGPINDRIDMEIYVPRVPYKKLIGIKKFESSRDIKKRVVKAREIQRKRFKNDPISYNSRMDSNGVKKHCALDSETEKFFEQAIKKLNLSARAFFRILKVSRTIADLSGEEVVKKEHLVEALSYKNIQRYYEI